MAVLAFVELQAGFQKPEVLDEIVLKVSLERELARSEVVFLGGLRGEIVRLGGAFCNSRFKIGFIVGGWVLLGIPSAEFTRVQLEEQAPARVWLYAGVMPTLGRIHRHAVYMQPDGVAFDVWIVVGKPANCIFTREHLTRL